MQQVLWRSVAYAISLGAKEKKQQRYWKRNLAVQSMLNLMLLVPMVFVFCSPMMWTDVP